MALTDINSTRTCVLYIHDVSTVSIRKRWRKMKRQQQKTWTLKTIAASKILIHCENHGKLVKLIFYGLLCYKVEQLKSCFCHRMNIEMVKRSIRYHLPWNIYWRNKIKENICNGFTLSLCWSLVNVNENHFCIDIREKEKKTGWNLLRL